MREEYIKYRANEERYLKVKDVKTIIFSHLRTIKETKLNHLDLSEESSYHKERFLIEKEKEFLLFDILEQIDNIL